MQHESIPQELRVLKQWVNWRIIVRDGKQTKIPYQPNGSPAKVDDPQTWSTFEQVIAADANNIGFVFAKENGYVGIDFDKCRNKDTGDTERWAEDVIRSLNS